MNSNQNKSPKSYTDSIDVLVGKKIRQQRCMVGMSQKEIAQIIGITFQQVQKYEKGQNRISAARLWRLSRALNVPVSAFFEEVEDYEVKYQNGGKSEKGIRISGNAKELIDAYYKIPDRKLAKQLFDTIMTASKLDSAG